MDLGSDLQLDRVVRHYENWRFEYHDKFIHLVKDNRHLFLRSVSRFDSVYRQYLKARMRRLKDIDWSVKLEITLDPKQFVGLFDEFEKLPKLWNNVNRWLSRTYGDCEFLRIVEIQKSGRPHLHVLVAFHDEKWRKYFSSMHRRDKQKRFQAFYSEFKEVVSRNGGGHVWVKPVQGHLNLVSYVLKYVNKSISGEENKEYSALLFASNRRLFSVSRGLRVFALPKRPVQGFEYVGCVPSLDLASYCESAGVRLGQSVLVEKTDPGIEYEYPLLFGSDRVSR